MVAGSVTPPRIDLRNRDLIRSHIHAIWMQTAKPDLGKTLRTVLDLTPDDGRLPLPVTDAIKEELRNPYRRAGTRDRAAPVITEIRSELAHTTWFDDEWVDGVLGQVELSFDAACERWRNLYRAAVRQRTLHHEIIGDHSGPRPNATIPEDCARRPRRRFACSRKPKGSTRATSTPTATSRPRDSCPVTISRGSPSPRLSPAGGGAEDATNSSPARDSLRFPSSAPCADLS